MILAQDNLRQNKWALNYDCVDCVDYKQVYHHIKKLCKNLRG